MLILRFMRNYGGKTFLRKGSFPHTPFSKDFITEFSPYKALHTRCENQ